MTNAAASNLAEIFTPSPAMDWTLPSVADDLKKFETQVDRFEAEAATWRAKAIARLSKLNLDAPDRAIAVTELNAAIVAVEKGLAAHSRPLHAEPEVVGKVMQELLRRIERIRVAQHAVHVDLYYGLLALQSELEGNALETEDFRDRAKLGASLRSQLA
jgi:hypothetical protein